MILSFYDAIGKPRGVESIPIDSDTVPDMSLSVKEILQRFRRGTVDINSLVRPSYDGTDDIDDDTLDGVEDLVDIQNLKLSTHGKVSEILRNHRECSHDDPSGSISSPEVSGEVKD